MAITKKFHARKLLELLEEAEYPCSNCVHWETDFDRQTRKIGNGEEYCTTCWNFLNAGGSSRDHASRYSRWVKESTATRGCPCICLGHEEAIRRTWIALEEGGYI